jgi:Cu2+-exporting ATPase/Cu+-exporting ATPase
MDDSAQGEATLRLRCEACSAPFESRSVWNWVRIAVGAFLAMNVMTFSLSVNLSEVHGRERAVLHAVILGATLAACGVVGSGLAVNAFRALRQRRITIEALFLLGAGGAFALSLISTFSGRGPVYYEVVAILVVVYALGRQLVSHSQESAIAALRREWSESACEVLTPAGASEPRPVSQLVPDDIVTVKPGETVPADGVVVQGEASVRETPITGEALPRFKKRGDPVLAGTHPVDGLLNIRITAPAADSEKGRLLDELGELLGARAAIQKAADRVARWFAPAVFSTALLTYLGWSFAGAQGEALTHALSVLVVACPCAIGFATPLAFWAALRQLSALGIDARGAETVERFANADCVVLDKTGTVTDPDSHCLQELRHDPHSGVDPNELRLMLAAAERRSSHPLATAFEELDAGRKNPYVVESLRLVAGRGFEATLRRAGSQQSYTLMVGMAGESDHSAVRELLVAVGGRPAAIALISESLHETAGNALEELERLGLRRIVATGDAFPRAKRVPADEWHASLSPIEKIRLVERLVKEGRRVLFVGDGLNDSGAMAASHASIAVKNSAPLAEGVAAAVTRSDDLRLIPRALAESRRALSVARTNLLFAAAYNTLGITIAAAGLLHPVAAAVLMVCSSLLVSWRASRLLPEEVTVP